MNPIFLFARLCTSNSKSGIYIPKILTQGNRFSCPLAIFCLGNLKSGIYISRFFTQRNRFSYLTKSQSIYHTTFLRCLQVNCLVLFDLTFINIIRCLYGSYLSNMQYLFSHSNNCSWIDDSFHLYFTFTFRM